MSGVITRILLFVLSLSLLSLPCAAARRRSVSASLIDTRRLLWIGAHPDDETLIAPLLGPACAHDTSRCKMLVMTHGENGTCSATPEYCGSDLGTVRARELEASAVSLHATLELWDLPDASTDVRQTWAAKVGGLLALTTNLRHAIASFAPTAVLTLDPRHGSTCHAAHRAIGELVLDAVASMEHAPPVLLIETSASYEDGKYLFSRAIAEATPGIITPPDAWSWLIEVMYLHRSQFPELVITSAAAVPAADRSILLMPAESRDRVRYLTTCDVALAALPPAAKALSRGETQP